MEAAVAGAFIQLLGCVPQLHSCLCQQYDYVKDIEDKFSKLNVELQTLHCVRDDIEGEIQRRVTMTPTCQTNDWIARVLLIDSEFQKLETRYKKRSCGGRFPRCCRLDLSKKIEMFTIEITSLTENGKDTKKQIFVEVEPPPSRVETIYRSKKRTIFNKPVIEKVMDLLKDDEIKRIGIFGSPGVGKTYVMQEVNNAQKANENFDIVIWVNVKKDETIQNVQQQIVERLKLNVQGIESTEETARRIKAELCHKKYLLFLDDVLKKIDLNDVGIYDDHKGSKVVLTTLYRNAMNTCEEVEVGRLSEEEALELFMEEAGEIVEQERFKTLAHHISKECGGYMSVIVVVASSLKNVDNEALWWNALHILREPSTRETSLMTEISSALRFGYHQLKDDDKRNCFLYLTLYPEEDEINANYLIECWSAQGFIGVNSSLGDARNKGEGILKNLMDKRLLESKYSLPKSYRVKCVRLPRLLRSLASSLWSPDDVRCKLLVRSGKALTITPDEKEWKDITRISLAHNQLTSLPTNPECATLSTLLLQRNETLQRIPESFFEKMANLLLLDLHKTGICSLPQSLSSLISLKGLYLNSCTHLLELPSGISSLVNLELLDIRGTMIRHLPIELRLLVRHLRCLRVSFRIMNNCANGTPNNIIHQQVEMIPQGLLSDLNSLEELRIDVDLHDERWKQIVDFVVKDVSELEKLKNLQFYFPTIKSLEQFVSNNRSWMNNRVFMFFRFVVGSHDTSPYHSHILKSSQYLIERYFRFSAGNDIPDPVLQVLHHTDTLELVDLQNVAKLSEIHTVAMGGLRICVVTGCKNMVCFINYAGAVAVGVLRFLELLELINLPELKSIWEGIVPPKTFGRLKTLTLKGCSKLEKIFSEGLISQLLKLEELTVDDCSGIKEIINQTDNPSLVHDTLPALHSLVLVNLPELVSICQDISLSWSSLERIKIISCDNLKKLPFKSDSASKLNRIECDRTWWNALDWTEVTDEAKDRLSHFISFVEIL